MATLHLFVFVVLAVGLPAVWAVSSETHSQVSLGTQGDDCSAVCGKAASDPLPADVGKWGAEATYGKLCELCKSMSKTEREMVLYSWSSVTDCLLWGVAGSLDPETMDLMTSGEGESGGGLYMAEDATKLQDKGVCLVRITIAAGTLLYDEAKATGLVGTMTVPQKVWLGKQIPFIHLTGGSTYVTHHHGVGKKLEVHGELPSKVKAHIQWDKLKDMHGSLQKLVYHDMDMGWESKLKGPRGTVLKNSFSYLKSFWSLASYYDGPSFMRACLIRPDDPWQIFDPEHFGLFHNAILKYMYKGYHEPCSIGVSCNGKWGGKGKSPEEWSKWVQGTFLPGLWEEIAGEKPPGYRDFPVRGGGDEPNETFQTTKNQAEAMDENVYLTVHASKDERSDNDQDFLAYYYYPDVAHNEKLQMEGYLSSGLKQKVNTKTTPEWEESMYRKDRWAWGFRDPQAQSLTRNVIEELVVDLPRRLYDQPTQFDTLSGVLGPVGLVSIHPWGDFNGRTTRFWGKVASIDSNEEFACPFISDFDTVMDKDRYGKFLKAATVLYGKFKEDMFAKMIEWVFTKGTEAKWNDTYKDLPSFYDLIKSLDVFAGNGVTFTYPQNRQGWTEELLNLISRRNWVLFIDTLAGGNTKWRENQ